MLGDSVSLNHLALKDCRLTALKDNFNIQFFGFPFPKHQLSDLRENVSLAVINLGIQGTLKVLQEKWMPQHM